LNGVSNCAVGMSGDAGHTEAGQIAGGDDFDTGNGYPCGKAGIVKILKVTAPRSALHAFLKFPPPRRNDKVITTVIWTDRIVSEQRDRFK
jgi:hypothetical protein